MVDLIAVVAAASVDDRFLLDAIDVVSVFLTIERLRGFTLHDSAVIQDCFAAAVERDCMVHPYVLETQDL